MSKLQIAGTAADITADWINQAFVAGGTAYPTVTQVSAVPIGSDHGFMGEILRCHLAYVAEAPDAPMSVIVKLPGRERRSRTLSRRLGLYAREYAFYTRLGDQVPVRIPRLYYTDFNPETDDFVIVQEDLDGMVQMDQVTGATADQARTILRGLATLHASFLGNTRDDRFAAGVWKRSTRWKQFQLQVLYLMLLPSVRRNFADCLSPRLSQLTLDFGCSLTQFRRRAASLTPFTFTHGDFRLDNLFFDSLDPTAGMTMIDWQVCAIAPGMRDVAYFLATNVEPEVRRSIERDVVEEYRETMARAGTVLDLDVWWQTYRVGILGNLLTSVLICGGLDPAAGSVADRAYKLVRISFRRSLTAIEDLNAAELLHEFGSSLPTRLLWRGFSGVVQVLSAVRGRG